MEGIENYSPKWLIDKIRNSKSEAEALVYIYEYSNECQFGLVSKDQHEKDVKEVFRETQILCIKEFNDFLRELNLSFTFELSETEAQEYYDRKFKTNE